MALVNSLFLAGCASVRSPARLARLQETPVVVELAIQSWESVAFIPVLSSVAVDLTTGETLSGKFRSADEQTLILEDGGSRSIPRAEIQRVVINGGRQAGTGALWGLGIGAVSGVGWWISIYESDPEAILLPLMLSGIGAGIGALIGTASRDRTVIYESPISGATN